MKTSIPAAVEAAKVAASVIELICRSPKFTEPGHPHQYRSPEQISLIVDMVNAAMDAVLSLNVGTVEAIAEPINLTPCRECHGTPINCEVSIIHDGNTDHVLAIQNAFKQFISQTKKGDAANESQGN